jgi:hypothetical protein
MEKAEWTTEETKELAWEYVFQRDYVLMYKPCLENVANTYWQKYQRPKGKAGKTLEQVLGHLKNVARWLYPPEPRFLHPFQQAAYDYADGGWKEAPQ